MTKTATIERVPRKRGVPTDEQRKRIDASRAGSQKAQDHYRAVVVETLSEGVSFSEISRITGLSTNTLQRWKREAGK